MTRNNKLRRFVDSFHYCALNLSVLLRSLFYCHVRSTSMIQEMYSIRNDREAFLKSNMKCHVKHGFYNSADRITFV